VTSAPALRVEQLGKRYRTGLRASYGRLSETLYQLPRSVLRRRSNGGPPANVVWALRDVSFEVEQGEAVGIVGRNGAGKTTLLKVLSQITEPTEGRVGLNGRVGSLLEVGTGFHPELTGRENIMLNGAILGMRRREILRKFDDIVEFAETGAFLDTPVKRYSSGMYVRLAFAVAAHLEPDILIVDEVLAVGDAAFQQKCLGKMGEVAREGLTVLFVSHNVALVSSLCPRSCWLERGRLVVDGETSDVVQQYLATVHAREATTIAERTDRKGNGDLRFTDLAVEGPAGPVRVGEEATLTLGFEARTERSGVETAVSVFGPLREPLFLCRSKFGGRLFDVRPGRSVVTCRLPELPLVPGKYSLNVFASAGNEILDWVEEAATFEVFETDYLGYGHLPTVGQGHFAVRQAWSAEGEAAPGT
jgi:lipopolysaccharide transport system ATP-binding protein